MIQSPEDLVPPRPSHPEQDYGGLVSQDEAGVTPSNVLSQQALARFPPELQTLLANRKIDRPENYDSMNLEGLGAQPIGLYVVPPLGESGDVSVARGTGGYDPAEVAQHELLHALSYEHPAWAEDSSANFADLVQATKDSIGRSQYPAVDAWLKQLLELRKDDPMHLFTDLGGAAIVSRRYLPPPLAKYFAPLLGDRYSTIPAKQR